MKTIQRTIIGIIALMLVASCSAQKGGESAPQTSPSTVEQSGNQQKVTQAPFSLPDGYQAAETTSFKFAVPKDWNLKKGENLDALVFLKDGKAVGETEILGWFDLETWRDLKPNHSDQTDFQETQNLLSIDGLDVHIYRIKLTHTKPAAALDPDWQYRETRWYVAVKETDRAYGFYFSSDQVDELTMKTILSTFRLIVKKDQ